MAASAAPVSGEESRVRMRRFYVGSLLVIQHECCDNEHMESHATRALREDFHWQEQAQLNTFRQAPVVDDEGPHGVPRRCTKPPPDESAH